MKTDCTKVVRTFAVFLTLTGLFGRCSVQDHQPNTCAAVQALLADCPVGYRLLVRVNKTNFNRFMPSDDIPFEPGKITIQGDACFYDGHPIIENTPNNIKVDDGTYWNQYVCRNM
ncbi:hypothetical protein [Larkinella harenae]